MGFDGYVQYCRTVKKTDTLYTMLADHNTRITNATNEQAREAWTRMQRIVRAEISRRNEGGKTYPAN